jgi:hypothetical protein
LTAQVLHTVVGALMFLATLLGIIIRPWRVSEAGAAVLLACAISFRGLDWRRLVHEISWAIVLFITGMFIVVQDVADLGLTRTFGQMFIHIGGANPLRTTLVAAVGANLINNVPITRDRPETTSRDRSPGQSAGAGQAQSAMPRDSSFTMRRAPSCSCE